MKMPLALVLPFLIFGTLSVKADPWEGSAYHHILVSDKGSSRATAYSMTPKFVQKNGLVHFVYTNTQEESIVRTYDTARNTLSPETVLGTGADNHSDPGIIIDGDGHLHVFFGPHHAPLTYRKSVLPNDTSQWTTPMSVGVGATYASIVCDKNNTLHLIYRGGEGGFSSKSLFYQRKPVDGLWTSPKKLVSATSSFLISYDNTIGLGQNRSDLYIAYNYFDSSTNKGHMIGMAKSVDGGNTWATVIKDKHPLQDKITDQETTTASPTRRFNFWPRKKKISKTENETNAFNAVVASYQANYRAANFVIDKDENIFLLVHDYSRAPKEAYIYKISRGKITETLALSGLISKKNELHSSANMSLIGDRLHVAIQYSDLNRDWSDESTGIALFESEVKRGRLNDLRLIEKIPPIVSGQKKEARFLPSLERWNGHNEIGDKPFLLYTEGLKGGSLSTESANRVYFAIPR